MADFGIILFDDTDENNKEKPANALANKIKHVLRGRKIELKINQIELYKDLNMFLIYLQHSKQSILNIKAKYLAEIQKAISNICLQNNIKHCITPPDTPEKFLNGNIIKYKSAGQYLYSSLVMNIIYGICSDKGKNIGDIEISIINGDDEEKLWSLIGLLHSKIKYLTILTEKVDLLTDKTDSIYDETGLSIRLTSNSINAFKDVDLIINLNNFYDFKSSYKLNTNTIVINYSEAVLNWINIENIIVNNISVELPIYIKNKVDFNLFKYFNNLELSEIILCHKKNIEDEVMTHNLDCKIMEIMSNEFSLNNFSIGAYVGRRGILKKIV